MMDKGISVSTIYAYVTFCESNYIFQSKVSLKDAANSKFGST